MDDTRQGSATRWGPLFGARARDWAETWEGRAGWGTTVYGWVLDHAPIGPSTRVLDCGCGAGRFTRMAADRGATVSGVDAAAELVAIAAERTPEGDFRVGEIETLPWPDDAFDVVTGFSSFQFADDKTRALSEAARVARGRVAVAIPTRREESGIAAVFRRLFPLFPPEALEGFQRSGIFALSEPGALDRSLLAAGLRTEEDEELSSHVLFPDAEAATRAFLGAGPTGLALRRSGEVAVTEALRAALTPFTGGDGRVTIPSWFRVVMARAQARSWQAPGMHIRPEEERDAATVAQVVERAFGQPDEARLVAALHLSGHTELSLVAERDGVVVGHILFSRIDLVGEHGGQALALAPMAVEPSLQGQGIGSALVRAGLGAARERGDPLVVVLGHAGYYPRFGFRPARVLGIEPPFPVTDEVWMALPLTEPHPRGTVRYAPAFSDVT
jgi:predicted N-acetyltransferase YhbS